MDLFGEDGGDFAGEVAPEQVDDGVEVRGAEDETGGAKGGQGIRGGCGTASLRPRRGTRGWGRTAWRDGGMAGRLSRP